MKQAMNRSRRQHGFSMLEILIALLLLAVGMMGIGALFVSGLQLGSAAILRTRAINHAEDMADRIRSNALGGASYVAGFGDNGANNNCTDVGGGMSGTAYAPAAICAPDQLAQHDIFTWKQALTAQATGLPGGQASIARDAGTLPATYTILIQWTEREEALQHTMVFQAP